MTDLELVRAVRALFGGEPERWMRRWFARSPGGDCFGDDDGACCWCLAGAAQAVLGEGPGDESEHRLAEALDFASWADMSHWNDAPGRTFAEVDARLAEAEARLANA